MKEWPLCEVTRPSPTSYFHDLEGLTQPKYLLTLIFNLVGAA